MDGILVVNKAQRMTSHDVVDLVRRRFGLKKVGHAGTLDPIATGVLVMLLGSYTKLSGALMAEDKEYEATLTLGGRSDTGDAWGNVVPSGAAVSFSREALEEAFARFRGEIEQVPPMYSAVKRDGRKLYELARKGVTVEVEPRKVTISRLEIKSAALPHVRFAMACSKGTYVRQLCADIGEALGCGGYMSALERTRSGAYTLAMSVGIEDLRRFGRAELAGKLISR
jgi:tRNA pseudouridine55 synthase